MTDKLSELKTKRDELRARLEAIEKDYRAGLDKDSEEQAQQLENAEVLNEISRTTAEELARIEKEIEELT
jgi:hypothetical protein